MKELIKYDDLIKKVKYDPILGIICWDTKGRRFGKELGCIHKGTGYKIAVFNKYFYEQHRLAWLLYYGKWPNKHIDHINGIRSDNRISNLREATFFENAQNKRMNREGKYPGIDYRADMNAWVARISNNGKRTYLGAYLTEEEALKAREEAIKLMYKGYPILSGKKEYKRYRIGFHKITGKWQLTFAFTPHEKRKYIGIFISKEEAEKRADLLCSMYPTLPPREKTEKVIQLHQG